MHSVEMDLSLERVKEVAERLNLLNPRYLVVTVAGTNGKGSTVAGLEAIYLAAGYRVGAFTSPFLFSYNEQVRVQAHRMSRHYLIGRRRMSRGRPWRRRASTQRGQVSVPSKAIGS